MRQALAIAAIAIRNAIRSRVVVSLFALLALIIVGLPATVKGDGTVEGYARVLLSYTLGFASFVLALATVWAGCSALSSEVDTKQIQMVTAKPVPRMTIWLGKWMGLLFINTLMLAVFGASTYGLLLWQARRQGPEFAQRLRERVMVSRQTLSPTPPTVDEQAHRLLREKAARQELPQDMAPGDAFNAIRRTLLVQAFTAPPGGACAWSFRVPAGAESLTLRYRLAASHMDVIGVRGLWSIGDRFRKAVDATPGAWQELELPALGEGVVNVLFANTDERGVTVLFDPDNGAQILMPRGRFETNLARALLVVWSNLAFLAAISLTAGAIFSLPVAAFASLYVIVLLQATDYVAGLSNQAVVVPWQPADEGHAGVVNMALRGVFKSLNAVLQPLRSEDPLTALASGQLVSWAWVGHDFLIKVLLYGGLLAAAGAWIFNRRELALPT